MIIFRSLEIASDFGNVCKVQKKPVLCTRVSIGLTDRRERAKKCSR